jgi:hypothetical protein
MSMSRLSAVPIAVFLATGISVDPGGGRSAPPPRPRVSVAHAEVPSAPPGIDPSSEPVPSDVTVEVTPADHGAHRVVVRRPGFLVSLRNEDARSAGVDWTAMRVSPKEGGGRAAGRLVWETTHLSPIADDLATTRGLVILAGDGGALGAELRMASTPAPAATWSRARTKCVGQHDGLGGFTVLCRFAKGVRVTGAANVTSARSLDDVWLTPGQSPLVRLDMPRSPGGAEGRVVGITQGIKGVVLRVEASFPEGDPPALVVEESERAQPVPQL